jgi:hypothetical protein
MSHAGHVVRIVAAVMLETIAAAVESPFGLCGAWVLDETEPMPSLDSIRLGDGSGLQFLSFLGLDGSWGVAQG